MDANPFIGWPRPPTDAELSSVLGRTAVLFTRAQNELRDEFILDGMEWNAWSKKSGWNLRLKKAGRNIVYLVPRRGFFLASFALGDKALSDAKKRGLPDPILELLASARKYAEGTAVLVPVRKVADLVAVKTLVAAKLES